MSTAFRRGVIIIMYGKIDTKGILCPLLRYAQGEGWVGWHEDKNLMDATWNGVFFVVIALVSGFIGSPIIQGIKNGLSLAAGKPVEDRWAMLIAGGVSAGLAVLAMWLTGQMNFAEITPDNFPMTFFAVYGASNIYYGLFKKSPSILGKRLLLKDSNGQG